MNLVHIRPASQMGRMKVANTLLRLTGGASSQYGWLLILPADTDDCPTCGFRQP